MGPDFGASRPVSEAGERAVLACMRGVGRRLLRRLGRRPALPAEDGACQGPGGRGDPSCRVWDVVAALRAEQRAAEAFAALAERLAQRAGM
jgi:hypothetical protein